jgi:nitric oxide reductase activation protein
LARRSLKPQLNQIRTWVRQGRTDAWIAHQLEVSVGDIRSFKREHELVPGEGPTEGDDGFAGTGGSEELDLRAEDDALVAAALEAEADEAEVDEPEVDEPETDEDAAEADEGDEDDDKPKRRRRGRRGGRGRTRRKQQPLEGTFDHGDEGYGLWLDPAIQDDPVYAEHWAGHRPVTVTVEAERIVITRAGEEPDDEDEE